MPPERGIIVRVFLRIEGSGFVVYQGHIQNGVVVLDEASNLPEGTKVQVALVPAGAEGATLGERLLKFAGRLEGLPPDLARNHDHYSHGAPKK
jgi:hypothetical protein